MKTVIGQNAQPECDLLRNSQPMELTKHMGYVMRLAEKIKRAAAFKTDCSWSCNWQGIPARTELQ